MCTYGALLAQASHFLRLVEKSFQVNFSALEEFYFSFQKNCPTTSCCLSAILLRSHPSAILFCLFWVFTSDKSYVDTYTFASSSARDIYSSHFPLPPGGGGRIFVQIEKERKRGEGKKKTKKRVIKHTLTYLYDA